MSIFCFADKHQSCEKLAEKICESGNVAIRERGKFSIVLSGGSTPASLFELLASHPWKDQLDWSNTLVFFGDERCVPADHEDSNFRMAEKTLLARVSVDAGSVFRIRGEDKPAVEAKRYENAIWTALSDVSAGQPAFDIVLLGLGSDGHTASLFPGDPALRHSGLVSSIAAPTHMMPSVERISLTLNGISMSRHICFLVDGSTKTDIVKAVLGDKAYKYPAAMVHGKTLSWYLSGMDCSFFSE